MDRSLPPLAEDARQRKLDDLFGDEPFLSPTMKARRLHEVAHVQPSGPSMPAPADADGRRHSPLAGLLPDVTVEEVGALWLRRTDVDRRSEPQESETERPADSTNGRLASPTLRIVATSTDDGWNASASAAPVPSHPGYGQESAGQPPIRLAEAAAYLRAACPSGAAAPGMERLQRFRIEVLLRWLKQVPLRGIDGSAEES